MLRTFLLALFLSMTILPLSWNKFDVTKNAELLYILGASLPVLVILSWNKITKNTQSGWIEKLFLIGFIAFMILSFVYSPIKNYGWSEIIVTSIGSVIFFITQSFESKERNFFNKIVAGLAFISVAVAMYWYINFSENRMAGIFFDLDRKAHFWPNAFALFLLMSWPIVLEVFRKKWNWLKTILLSFIFAALILTFSRAAFLTFTVQLIVLTFFAFRKKVVKEKVSQVGVIITLSVLIVFSLHSFREKNTNYGNNSFAQKIAFEGTERQTSLVERWQFFKGGLHFAGEKPLLGSGPGTFRYLYPTIQPEFLATSDHPHNWYIKIAMENGVPAALAFLIFLAIIFIQKIWQAQSASEIMKKEVSRLEESTLYGVALIGPLVHGLVDYNLNFLTNALLFWIILGFFRSNKVEKQNKIWPFMVFVLSLMIAASATFEGYLNYKLRSATDDSFFKSAQFPRDYWLNSSRQRVEKDLKDSEQRLLYHLQLSPYDSFGWNFLGHLEQKKGQLNKAEENFFKAVQNNPANFFAFYVDWLKVSKRLGTLNPKDAIFKEKALHFLQNYPEKIRLNVHYTKHSSNPSYAKELADMLGKTDLANKIEAAMRDKN